MKKTLLIIFLTVALAGTAWHSCIREVQLYRAKGTMQTVALLRDAALATTNVQTSVENLDYIVFRNPARAGGFGDDTLDVLYDSYMTNAVTAMISHMKVITGRDLGPDPEAWIKAYGHRTGGGEEHSLRP